MIAPRPSPTPTLLAVGIGLALGLAIPDVLAAPQDHDTPARTESGQVFERLDPSRPPALGPDDARVVVLVFSDFQCPVCRRSAAATRQIPEEFPGEVRVEFVQNALAMHRNAEDAAVASLAAQRQGKFWDYHDELFENQRALDPASLEGHAARLGLDMDRFRRDYADPVLRERVRAERAAAEKLGARATPAFMFNGKLAVGWGSWSSFRSSVEREVLEARKIAEAGLPAAKVAETRAQSLIADAEQLATYSRLVAPPPPAASASEGDSGKAADQDKKKKKKKSRKERAQESDAAGAQP